MKTGETSGGTRSMNLGLALCAFALMLDGLDNQLLGLLIPSLIGDWHLPRSTFTPFIIVTVLLMSAGTSFGGWLGDKFGRKPVLVGSLLWLGTLTLASGAAADATQLLILRGLSALGMGGVMPNATALLAEYVARRHRGLSVSVGIAGIPLGGVLGGLVGSLVIPAFGWRAMFAIAGALTVLAATLIAAVLPESPSLAAARSRHKRIDKAGPHDPALQENLPTGGAGQSIMDKAFRRDTLALWCALFFSMLGVYSMINWVPTLLDQQSKGPAVASLGLAMFNAGGIVGGIVIAGAMDRIGSRMPLFVTGITGCILAALAIPAIAPGNAALLSILPLTAMGACIAGMQAALIAFSAQVYPTAIRSTGMGAAMAVGRLGALASSVTGTLVLGFGSAYFLMAMGVATLFAGFSSMIAREWTPSRVRGMTSDPRAAAPKAFAWSGPPDQIQ